MAHSLFTLSLISDIALIQEDEKILLQSPTRRLIFHRPQPGLQSALICLKNFHKTASQLKQLVVETDGFERGNEFDLYIQKLINLGWICHSLLPLAVAIPMAENYQFDCISCDWQQEKFILSRFAYLHQVNGNIILESPQSKAKIILYDWRGLALIGKLSQLENCTTLISEIPEITEEIAQHFISLLLVTKMLQVEAENSHLMQWEFHDLLFHSRSRVGRHNNLVGETFRFFGKIEPLTGVKSLINDKGIQLYQPHFENLAKTDISLTQALESRRSIRNYNNDSPITIKQLGELLYRCARIKEIIETEKMGQLSRRPYPAGGGVYELEIYPVINRCDRIDSGLYHYQPLEHLLHQVSDWNQDVEQLIKDAWFSSGQQDKPHILLVITARFGRLFWKYQGLAYALILKHVGVLYQNLYLVATEMNLAPCALGKGNSDLFAKASGIDYYEESSVGEFMLGSRVY
jgi:SagB-type dehydrogenase family enzyme